MMKSYIIIIMGDDFHPSKIINQLKMNDFIIPTIRNDFMMHDPEDYNDRLRESYGFGSIHLNLKEKYSSVSPDKAYEQKFIQFYEDNYRLLVKSGADDFRIFLEIYLPSNKDNLICDFEIFDKENLAKLAEYNVALPISIYLLHDN